jgi:hypothetical protein
MFQRIASEKFGAFSSLRVTAIAEAIDKKNQWPTFAMSSFEKQAAVARCLSQFMLIGIFPWVDIDTHIEYKEYTAQVRPSMV